MNKKCQQITYKIDGASSSKSEVGMPLENETALPSKVGSQNYGKTELIVFATLLIHVKVDKKLIYNN